jgi:diaminopimelate decarboxylase
MFAFDSEPELKKLARSAPGARVYCRILVENLGRRVAAQPQVRLRGEDGGRAE